MKYFQQQYYCVITKQNKTYTSRFSKVGFINGLIEIRKVNVTIEFTCKEYGDNFLSLLKDGEINFDFVIDLSKLDVNKIVYKIKKAFLLKEDPIVLTDGEIEPALKKPLEEIELDLNEMIKHAEE